LKEKYTDKLTIGTPFYNSSWCLDQYLGSIIALDYPKELIDLIWIDNGSTDSTKQILFGFKKQYGEFFNKIEIYDCKRVKESINKSEMLLWKMKWKKNIVKAINMFVNKRDQNTDLVMLGSDCIPPRNGLKKLLDMKYLGADIGAGMTIILSGSRLDKYGRSERIPVFSAFTSMLAKHSFGGLPVIKTARNVIALPIWLRDKVITVLAVGTGFCIIRKEVLKKIKFEIDYMFGEDLHFCYGAYLAGFNKIYFDTSLWYDHLHYSYILKKKKIGFFIIFKGENPQRYQW